MNYHENISTANESKKSYLNSIERLIKEKQEEVSIQRKKYANDIISRPEEARCEFEQMLGWPLNTDICDPLSADKQLLSEEEDYNIYRMKFEIIENFYFYGLFFEYRNQKLPLVISQLGGSGTPELCSGVYGDTSNYNNMTERILKQGVNVFAPQLLIWNQNVYEVPFVRLAIDSQLKQLGGSVAALEVYCIRSAINYFEKLPCVDEKKLGMVGLSYGGFYTLFTMASDTRIKTALSSAFFNDRYKYPWADWTWRNSAAKFFDSEIALLCYPRKLWISVGSNDELFDIDSAKKEYDRLCGEIQNCGIDSDWLQFEVHGGIHEFCKDNAVLEEMIKSLKA